MGMEENMFGTGPKELGGTIDLINHFQLMRHHEFFCKRGPPLSISDSHYLRNVVGDTKIIKGEGMELDQLFNNVSCEGDKNEYARLVRLHIFRNAFEIQETSTAGKRIPSPVVKLMTGSKESKQLQGDQINKDAGNDETQKQQKGRHKVRVGEKTSTALKIKGRAQLKHQKKVSAYKLLDVYGCISPPDIELQEKLAEIVAKAIYPRTDNISRILYNLETLRLMSYDSAFYQFGR